MSRQRDAAVSTKSLNGNLGGRFARRKQNQQDYLNLDPEIKCYLPGVPRATYMPYPFQILQSASALTFVYEYAGVVKGHPRGSLVPSRPCSDRRQVISHKVTSKVGEGCGHCV